MYRTYSQRIRRLVIETVDLQSLGAELKIIGEIDNPGYRDFNPSIAFHNGKLKIALRRCNFAVERHGRWYFRDNSAYSKTDVLYGDLDPDTLQVSDLRKLELSEDSPIVTRLAGLEDVRLFSRKDGMHAIGFESDRITRSLHNKSTSMAEYLIKGNQLKYLRTLKKPDPETVEKNWCPTDVPSNIFDTTYSDTQSYKDGKLIGKPSTSNIHGGSQLLLQRDGTYLSIVHEKKLDPKFNRLNNNVYDKYIYHHYLAKHDEYGIITELSKAFTFGTHENIEFAAGMVEYNGDFLITVGVRDCRWLVCRISEEKLFTLFNT